MSDDTAQFEAFVSKLIDDEAFRERASSDLLGAIREMGIAITPQIRAAVHALGERDGAALRELAEAMENKVAAIA